MYTVSTASVSPNSVMMEVAIYHVSDGVCPFALNGLVHLNISGTCLNLAI
jgi:hypothetical protein